MGEPPHAAAARQVKVVQKLFRGEWLMTSNKRAKAEYQLERRVSLKIVDERGPRTSVDVICECGPFCEPAVADPLAEVEVPHFLAASETTVEFGLRLCEPHKAPRSCYQPGSQEIPRNKCCCVITQPRFQLCKLIRFACNLR